MARHKIVNFAVDSVGTTISAASIEVRDKAGNLVTLYEAATGSTQAYSGANPFNAGDGTPDPVGYFEFWVDAIDRLDITVGTGVYAITHTMYLPLADIYETRSAFVADIASGMFDDVDDGFVVTVDGVKWVKSDGATTITDMPDWLPTGILYAEHFGLNADLAFTSDANGYTRTTGTDDRAAFLAADAYAISSGKGFFFCKSDVFIDGQVDLSATLHWETGFRNFCWSRVGETESGFVITDGNGGLSGINIIIQHNTTSKEPNRGHHGNAVTVGKFGDTVAHTRITGVHIDVRVNRAANVTGQDSYPSPSVNFIGYVEYCSAKLGTFGVTNSPGTFLFQSHWGGYNPSGDMTLEPTFTYHPNNNTVEFTGIINGHKKGFILSSVFNFNVGDATFGDDVKEPFVFLVGDNVNDYAIAAHAPHIGRGNRVGFITAKNCEIDTGDSDDAILITSRGTSKHATFPASDVAITGATQANPCEITAVNHGFPTGRTVLISGVNGMTELNGNVYTITSTGANTFTLNNTDSTAYGAYTSGGNAGIPLIKQIPIDLEIDGIDLTLTGTNTTTTGVRVFGATGKINLGEVYVSGETKASVEVEYTNADVTFDVRAADKEVLYEYSTGGSILGAHVDKSADYNSANYCIKVEGDELTTTTAATGAEGDTSIAIARMNSDEVHVGDRIIIDGQPVYATAFVDSSVPLLEFTPLQGAVGSGATVTVDRRARLKRLESTAFSGSEYGILFSRATVDYADLSDVKWTGRNVARLEDKSIVRLAGDFPITSSRLVTSTDYTFRVGVDCSLHLLPGVRVPYNADLEAHVLLQRTGSSGPWGTLIAHGTVIEDVSNFYSSNDGFRQARMLDCIDYNGALIDHPDGRGSDANGYWVKHSDGTMECWVRNLSIGATQPYTWTFPGGGFIETASISVQATSASATAPRMAHGLANSATTATVWIHNDDGTDATSAGINLYAKGFWRV